MPDEDSDKCMGLNSHRYIENDFFHSVSWLTLMVQQGPFEDQIKLTSWQVWTELYSYMYVN